MPIYTITAEDYFYPRSPCGERPASGFFIGSRSQFLSTLSLRRATFGPFPYLTKYHYFYPRSPCGERQLKSPIKTHTKKHFYPRSPCGERQSSSYSEYLAEGISIHALLAESDLAGPSGPAFLYNFYPRSPCGERRE